MSGKGNRRTFLVASSVKGCIVSKPLQNYRTRQTKPLLQLCQTCAVYGHWGASSSEGLTYIVIIASSLSMVPATLCDICLYVFQLYKSFGSFPL